MKARLVANASAIDHKPSTAVSAGDFVAIAGRLYVASRDIAANQLGSLLSSGIFSSPKAADETIPAGSYVYWNATGDPQGGVAGSGAMTSIGRQGVFAGTVVSGGGFSQKEVQFILHDSASITRLPVSNAEAAGSTQGDAVQLGLGLNDVLLGNGTRGVRLPDAVVGDVAIVNNNAGGILKVYPATGDAINSLSANAAINVAANASAMFIAINSSTWITVPKVPS